MAGKEKIGPALAGASASWAKTLHPRPSTDEACAWMAAVFRGGRHLCRAEACPRVCPRSPDHGAPAAPPAWSTPIPPMTADEIAAQEKGLAPLRAALGLDRVRRLDVAVDDAPEDDPSGPQCLMCGDDERACSWCDKPGAAPTTPATPVSVPAMSPPATSRGDIAGTYPPCSACGKVRTIMMVMAGAFGGAPHTICGRCYRGERS